MSRQNVAMTTFYYGEISAGLFGRGNFQAYRNSAMKLCNMDVVPTGGIVRRNGTVFVDGLNGCGKLIAFEYSSGKKFILVFGDKTLDVYENGKVKVASIKTPYGVADLCNIRWVQKDNQMFLAHPDIEPQILRYEPLVDEWAMVGWEYARNSQYGYSCQPFARFEVTRGITIKPSGTTGNVTLTASRGLFDARDVGVLYSLCSGEVKITGVRSATIADAVVTSKLANTNDDANWQEQAFSKKRGFPTSITFFQNRLVIGGSKSLPSRLWFSCVGKMLDFSLGTGLDDEAIEFDIFSDKVNEIVSVFSGRHLQVFTTDAEWMVTGSPFTPSNITVSQQTKIGSVSDRYIPPKLVEGSTIFVARNKREIREFFYGDISENYSSEDLIMLSNHLLAEPVEQDYNIKKRTLYVVQLDGTMAVLLSNKSNGINAWVQYKTDGKFCSVAVLGSDVFIVVERGGKYFLEMFDERAYCDCAKIVSVGFDDGDSSVGADVDVNADANTNTNANDSDVTDSDGITVVDGLDYLNGRDVVVNADDYIFDLRVENGSVTIPKRSKNVMVGLGFEHIFCPLSLFIGGVYLPRAVRLLRLRLRVMKTPLLQIDTGRGLRNITFLNFDSGNKYDEALPYFDGDLTIRGQGFIRNYQLPLFKIQGSKPYPLRVLNLLAEVEVIR